MKNKIDPSKLVERPYPSGECKCHCHMNNVLDCIDPKHSDCIHCTKSGSLQDLMGTGEFMVNKEKIWNCRFHPTDSWHEAGCPHQPQERNTEECKCHCHIKGPDMCICPYFECEHCQPQEQDTEAKKTEDWRKKILAEYSPQLGVMRCGNLITFIREEIQKAREEGYETGYATGVMKGEELDREKYRDEGKREMISYCKQYLNEVELRDVEKMLTLSKNERSRGVHEE